MCRAWYLTNFDYERILYEHAKERPAYTETGTFISNSEVDKNDTIHSNGVGCHEVIVSHDWLEEKFT